jgi:hypothetical protein
VRFDAEDGARESTSPDGLVHEKTSFWKAKAADDRGLRETSDRGESK